MAYGDAETLFSEVGSELGKRILQMSTMPSASVDYLNMIIQYIGTTNGTYTNGYFYKCIYDNDNSEYIWINVEVQDNNAYFGTGTLLANGWSNKQQTLTFVGYKASMNGVIGIPTDATAAQKAAYTEALVDVISQNGDSFTFKVENVPSIDLPVVIYAGGGSGSGGGGGASALADLTDVDIDSSSLADGNALVYNATSGKWENGEGGGSGTVITGEVINITAGDDTTSRTFTFSKTPKFISMSWASDSSWKYSGSFPWGSDRLYFNALNSSPALSGAYVGVSTITYGQDGKSFTITGGNAGGCANTSATSGKMYVDYSEGSSSGGGSSYKKDTLFESTTDVSTFALSHPYTDYDAIVVTIKYSGSTAGTYYATGYFTTDQLTNASGSYGIATDDWYVYFEVASATSFTKSSSRYSFVCKIEGLKFGGGGGGALVDDIIYENTTGISGAQQITITKAVSNYDALSVVFSTYNDGGYATRSESYYSPVCVRGSIDFQCLWYPTYGNRYMIMTGDPESTTVTLTTGVYGEGSGYTPIVYEVHGIKFGGSSDSGGGTDVEANPQETPTDTLETIKIGNTVYDIAGSGGSGKSYDVNCIWDYTVDNSGSILYGLATATLNDDISNYDELLIEVVSISTDPSDTNWNSTCQFRVSVEALVQAYNAGYILCESAAGRTSRYYIHDNVLQKTSQATANTNGLVRVYGINYNGGKFGNTKEIVRKTNVAISDNLVVTLDLTKKYKDPYVFAVNVLPKTNWGGLVVVNEDYGLTYDSANDTLSFKVYTNSPQNYDIDWIVFDLSDGGSSSEDYSTTEKRVGTWIDGKPLYQTTLSLTSSSGNADQQVSLSDYGISNIETVCKIEGTALATLGYVALNYFASSNDCFNIYMTSNNTVMVLAHYGNWTHSIPVYVTLQYTKTTD